MGNFLSGFESHKHTPLVYNKRRVEMTKFIEALNKQINQEYVFKTTENGALGYATTLNPFVDFNFKIPSYRKNVAQAVVDFAKCISYDANLAMRFLFYLRDVRGGLGERNTFREIAVSIFNIVGNKELLKLFPEYGRWDDLIYLYFRVSNKKVRLMIISILRNQLIEDAENFRKGKPISLLAKWLPSITTKGGRKYALALYSELGFESERKYRKTLSLLRKHLDVVERKMSAGEWEFIDYSTVPSKANVKYNSAFLRHDESRRRNFLGKVERGEAKINSSVNYPHDIVHEYCKDAGYYWQHNIKAKDAGLEALWKALPEFDGGEDILVVADTSGSMFSRYGSGACPYEVCYALAIYFAERAKGCFKDKAILFSNKPQFIDMSKGKNLQEKLNILFRYNEIANTDIASTFKLILKTAVASKLKQEDMPKTILVISDMEFDQGANFDKRLFEAISQEYEEYGYKLPKLVFWNVASRTNTIPLTENENGIALVSGYSTNIVRMVLSNKLDAFEILKEQLMDKRYDIVEELFSIKE